MSEANVDHLVTAIITFVMLLASRLWSMAEHRRAWLQRKRIEKNVDQIKKAMNGAIKHE